MIKYLHIFIFTLFFASICFSQNPRIKVNYKVQRGMMRSFNTATSVIQNTGGACTETGAIEIRVHARLKSSSGFANGSNASYNATNTCPSGTCNSCATGDAAGWSCEQRCETATNAGACGNWVVNGSQNPTYPGDPGYVDTSSYPSNDVLEVQMKGFETDNFNAILNSDRPNFNYNDGACQTTCSNGNCYGNYQIPTSGRYGTVDIGAITNTIGPFCGSNWSSNFDAAYEGTACALDLTGFRSYYYLQWQYRWCWDSTSLFNRHAGNIKVPTIIEYCSGDNVIILDSISGFEVNRGFATYQWEKNSGSGWSSIAGATSTDLSTATLTNLTTSPIVYQIRRATLFCIDFTPAANKKAVYSNIVSVTVFPQPVAPTLFPAGTSPATGTTICKGLFVYAQFNPGTGGYTNASDEYQYSINNGVSWSNYTPGNSINTASAVTSVQVRVRRLAGSLSSCVATNWSILVTWPISVMATPPSITVSSPSNNNSICLSGTSQITGTITEGNGGTGFEYGYSISNASSPSIIFTGTPPTSNFTISTTGASVKINLFGRRTGVGAGTCSPTPWALIGEWPIVNQPVEPTLNTKTPNTSTVNEGDSVLVNANNGSGGASDANDEYRISTDNGSSWSNYTIGTKIQVPSGATVMKIEARRLAGSSFGCTSTSWTELSIWSVNAVLPIELMSFSVNKINSYNQLIWSTATEINSKEFTVLKSQDALNWTEIGNISAAGHSSEINNYSFLDFSIDFPTIYYRLKMIDLDNSFNFSNIINIENENKSEKSISLYPNPTSNFFTLDIKSNSNSFNLVEVKDVLGKILMSSIITENQQKVVFNCNDLAKGTYFIVLHSTLNNNLKTIKLIKY